MKMLFAAMTLTFATSAFAESSHIYLFSCATRTESVSMTLVSSPVQGVSASDVVYKEQGRPGVAVPDFTTEVELTGFTAPKRLSFFNDGRQMTLLLPVDAMSAAARASAGMKVPAAIIVNGVVQEAACTGYESI